MARSECWHMNQHGMVIKAMSDFHLHSCPFTHSPTIATGKPYASFAIRLSKLKMAVWNGVIPR